MKGVVFNLLEEAVVRRHGDTAWDDILEAANLQGAYTSLGSYPDAEIVKLVEAGASALGQAPNEVLRWFGRDAMALLAKQYPQFFDAHRSALPFILSVNGIIHPEVRKLYAGAGCPFFHFSENSDGSVLMGYESPRRMCALAHGFIEGAADYYNEIATVEQPECMHRGDRKCVLKFRIDGAGHDLRLH